MATLYVTEYIDTARSGDATAPSFPAEAAIAEQTVAIGGASVQSSAFQNNTRYVRLHTDAICSVKFGTNPTATATTSRMAAGSERVLGVPMGAGFKVAVITNT